MELVGHWEQEPEFKKYPVLQTVQSPDELQLLQFAGQFIQAAADPDEKVPVGQFVHPAEPADEKVPAGQELQLVAPVVA